MHAIDMPEVADTDSSILIRETCRNRKPLILLLGRIRLSDTNKLTWFFWIKVRKGSVWAEIYSDTTKVRTPPFPSAWDDSDEIFGLLEQRLRLERGPMTFIEGEEADH